MRGLFITFEGPEGSGKTTQARRLAERLRAAGCEVVATREPGGTRTGEAIRAILQHDAAAEALYPEAEALLFAASRAQLVNAVILPALRRGACVVSDRFADSTVAYQGYGRGFDVRHMLEINAFAVGEAVPDLTFLLDVPVREGAERVRRRNAALGGGRDRFEQESEAFHERVREGYLALAARDPRRFRVVDTGREEDRAAGEIWEQARALVAARLGPRGVADGAGA
ncbi:MAG: dTMP kinase [Lentisphaerae bacterium]|nr:dTMP kinase [Lentisphaerota bacterium]